MNKVLALVLAFVTVCFVIVSVLFYQDRELRSYTEVADCYVAGIGDKPAQGTVYILTINKTTTLNVQASKTVNMGNIAMGDKFRIVIVRDDEQALQCIVRVEEKE